MPISETRHIILCVTNDLSADQRIYRIASSLKEAGFKVTVVGRVLPRSLSLKNYPYKIHRMKLWFHKGKLFYLEYNLRLFAYLIGQKVDIITANDLDTLLACFWVARIRNKRLIYDSHELFTEVPELVDRKTTRAIWLTLERWLFPKLKDAYTVNHSIANIYQNTYQVPVQVIRNVPLKKAWPISKDLNVPDNPILLYQGMLNLGRGLELMMKAMDYLPDYQLWIVGKGDLEEELKNLRLNLKGKERISFKGFVPFQELHHITRQAHLGLSLEEDRGANYRYASPNKVYDYIQAHVPVLVSDLPEMQHTVRQYKLGKVLPESQRNPKDLATAIQQIFENQDQYGQFISNCIEAAKELNWEAEKASLIKIYTDG